MDDENRSDEEDGDGMDESNDDSEDDESQPAEAADLFQILEHEGSDIRLPPHMKCAAHKMNNIAAKDVDAALEDQTYKRHSRRAMQKARALFKKQNHSTLAADHIRDNCGGKLFVIPNATRWNREA